MAVTKRKCQGSDWADVWCGRKMGLAKERDKMVNTEWGKISGWWLGAEPFVSLGHSVDE